MRILVVGDTYMGERYFTEAFAALGADHEIETMNVDPARPFIPQTPSELGLREYQGSPEELAERMANVEVLVVQGAPVTDRVLDASTDLRLVCCARGGPVNVDITAVSARGLPLVYTPGKNADAVADLTLAFMVMLARGLPTAQRFLDEGNELVDNWAGVQFLGSDLRRHVLGIIGVGQVGQRVAHRARAFGMEILAFDPFADAEGIEQVTTLEGLLTGSDFVSIHARATAENTNLIDGAALRQMRPGAFLINTARETLVDERALDDALASGHLAGAALDTVRAGSGPGRHPLLRHPNVVITPHIGGATRETLIQGAEMIAADIARFAAGRPLKNVLNRQALAA